MPITGFKLAVGTGDNVTLSNTITSGVFSLTFDRPVLYSLSYDGVYLVQANGASVTGYAPAEVSRIGDDGVTSYSTNGFSPSVNIHTSATWQGYDARTTTNYSAGKRKALPWTPAIYDTLILENSAVLLTLASPGGKSRLRAGVAASWLGFSFMSELPDIASGNIFCGSLANYAGKASTPTYDIGIEAKLAALPAYALTVYPPVATIIACLDKFYGPGLFATVDGSGEGYESFIPQGSTDPVGNTYSTNYGGYFSHMIGGAALHLVGDKASTSDKRKILKRLIQIGCQIYEGCRGAGVYDEAQAINSGYAGHFQWEFIPIITYLWSRDLTDDLAYIEYRSCVLAQPIIYTADHVSQIAVHSDNTKAHFSRRRTITAVSGNNISYPITTGDPAHINPVALRLVRESDGKFATFTAMIDSGASGGASDGISTIDTHPSPAFAVDDVVYFQAPWSIAVGYVDWRIAPTDAMITPGPQSTYRPINTWLEELLYARAVPGLWQTDWNAMKAYVEKAMLPASPGSGVADLPTHTADSFGFGMATAFYNAHKGSLGIA